jgi:hypothetical protein
MKTAKTKAKPGGRREGAGRPPLKNPRIPATFKLPMQTHHDLKALSKKNGSSQSNIIAALCDAARNLPESAIFFNNFLIKVRE